MKQFFEDRTLACLIDALARRYGKTPYEIMTEMSINEFNLNVAIMALANIEENKSPQVRSKNDIDFKRFGLKRTIIKRR